MQRRTAHHAGLRLNSIGSACPVALCHQGCIRAGDAQSTSLGSPGQVLPLLSTQFWQKALFFSFYVKLILCNPMFTVFRFPDCLGLGTKLNWLWTVCTGLVKSHVSQDVSFPCTLQMQQFHWSRDLEIWKCCMQFFEGFTFLQKVANNPFTDKHIISTSTCKYIFQEMFQRQKNMLTWHLQWSVATKEK